MGRSLWWIALLFASVFACGGHSTRERPDISASGGLATTGGVTSTGGVESGESTAGMSGTPASSPPLTEEAFSCSKNSDCVLATNACCRCNASSLDAVTAINKFYRAEHEALVCGEIRTCPRCYPLSDTGLYATCEAGRCVGVDIRQTGVLACKTKDDCKLRDERCCGCTENDFGPRIAIGVDQDAAYEALSCDAGSACEACAASLEEVPDGYKLCFDGRCQIGGLVH